MQDDASKAVRRTLIVSAGFPGGAGRFPLFEVGLKPD